jgi:hypothetical protein
VLVYPFLHDVEAGSRWVRLQALGDVWQPWWRRLPDRRARERALDDSFFLLPRIRGLLFPEAATPEAASLPHRRAEAERLGALSLDELLRTAPEHAVLRLTLAEARLAELRRLHFHFQIKDATGQGVGQALDANVTIEWIDVFLFPQSIGFLALKLRLETPILTAAALSDFHYHARLVHPPTVGWTLAEWTRRDLDTAPPFALRDLVDSLTQGLVAGPRGASHGLTDFAQGRAPARYSNTDAGQVYGQTAHLYTYACMGSPQTSPGDASVERVTTSVPTPEAEADDYPFESPTERVLYDLATSTDSRDPAYVPHPRQVDAMRERSLIALWENWQGMALRDNVVFLAVRESPLTLNVLAHNVESDYLHLYLLALFQWTRLSILSGQLVREKQHLDRDLSAVRKLLDQFMMLQNRFWFREVTRKPQGVEIYRRFQQGLDVAPLFEEVQAQLNDVSAYYDRRAERSVSTMLMFLTLVATPLSLTVDLFGNAFFNFHEFDVQGLVAEPSFVNVLYTLVLLFSSILVLWLVWQKLLPRLVGWWQAIVPRLRRW